MKMLRMGGHVILVLLLALVALGYRGDGISVGIVLLLIVDAVYVIRLMLGPRIIRY